MKKITLLLLTLVALSLSACNDDTPTKAVEAKLVVGKNLETFTLKDQFEKEYTYTPNSSINKLVLAFSKDVAHKCNDYFKEQKENFLASKNALFIADVSAAPSLIRSIFIMPGLKDFKHKVLILDNKEGAAPFKSSMNIHKIVTVELKNGTITQIHNFSTIQELEKFLGE